MPRTLTLTEAADMLKVHVDTVSEGDAARAGAGLDSRRAAGGEDARAGQARTPT